VSIVHVVYILVMVYTWLIVARALLSWFRVRPGTLVFRLDRVLVKLTEPYLGLFRRIVPTARVGSVGIDLSYVLALVVLFVLLQIVGRL